jgi:hypothetical protein
MLSLTEGRKIARIKGGSHNGQFIYLTENKGVEEIIIKDGLLIPLPNKKIIEKIYISAPSGAGKSVWAGRWVKEYKKMFKDRDVYLFSSVREDEALDKYDPIRVPLNRELLENPIAPEEIEDSLTVFDDIDTIRTPMVKTFIKGFIDWLLEQGRHHKIRMLITSHLLSDYKHTRRVLNEATAVVVFPRAGSGTYQIKQFLKTYCGFDKVQTKKFINLKSRWVAIYRSYPAYVIHSKGVYIPKDNDEE